MRKAECILLCLLSLALLPGCTHSGNGSLRTRLTGHKLPAAVAAVPQAPLPVEQDNHADLLIVSLRKRVVGQENSQRSIYRVVNDVDPIVKDALKQPSVQADLQRLADTLGISLQKMRENWISMQDADILIELGGDPEAVSPAGAVGVAQWMPASGASAGLAVNVLAAEKLTPQITETKRQMAWLEYLLRPNPNPQAPGFPVIPKEEVAPKLKELLKQLADQRLQRAALDERYDAKKSLFAQTRYLLGISGAYPSPSWLFQAYHGGAGGVVKTLKDWCGAQWPELAADAIKNGIDAGAAPGKSGQLTFETVYFGAKPTSHQAAFDYLYGRGDDHRHYWWKLKAAQEALDLYTRNTAESAAQCRALLPGSPAPMIWYGKDHPSILDLDGLRACIGTHELVPVKPGPDIELVKTVDDVLNATDYFALRPEAAGALQIIVNDYKKAGGKSIVRITDLTRTETMNIARDKRLAPSETKPPEASSGLPWPPGSKPIRDQFDYHTIGLEFDIERPTDPEDRKIMDYSIGYLEDRAIVLRMSAGKEGVWHIVPNPRYKKALAEVATSAKLPDFKGF